MVGNASNFSKIDILRCFLRLNRNISRAELSKELSLGEGTIRSILDILKSKDLLDSTKKGHFLNEKGNQKMEVIKNSISTPKNFQMKELYPEFSKTGIIIKNPYSFSSTYKLRDIAVKHGAEGAVILKYNEKLEAPGTEYMAYFKQIEKIFELEKEDVLVVSFAENERLAEVGCLSIALELSNEINSFLKEVSE